LPGGAVAMRNSKDPDTVLRYTAAEWRAFVLGVRDGEFDLKPWGPAPRFPHRPGKRAGARRGVRD
ncbi:DUF397 domain-containing protein, partial [Streptomyces atacamensis]|uniref:DUF397 domain-containing protein n=1 Tax=Streptomyces atacamensis TaxID=531966 RepID=UPI00399C627C